MPDSQKGRYLIEAGWVVPMTEPRLVHKHQRIGVEGARIAFVQGQEELPPPGWEDVRRVVGSSCVALPGFVNLHNHAAMTLMRGYADDMKLMEWLETRIWPLEAHLTGQDVYWGTLLACVEQLRGGTTTFADMYFFMEDAARAVVDSGARASLARGLIGFEDPDRAKLRENAAFFKAWNNRGEGRISVWLGPHAPYTCPPDYLRDVAATAKELDAGLHIHIAETRDEVAQLKENYGKSAVELIADAGMLDQRLLAAHCVYIDHSDINLLQGMRGGVAHNPVSNMKLASGIAPIPALHNAGIPVGLGTDGATSTNRLSMFTELRTASLLQKVTAEDPTTMPAAQLLWMATRTGAEILGLDDLGYIAPGAVADIILVDLDRPHLVPHHDVLSLLAYSAEDSDVSVVFVNGRLVMEKGVLLTVDEERVRHRADRLAHGLVERAAAASTAND